jgi:predicted flavoprotein YhiN
MRGPGGRGPLAALQREKYSFFASQRETVAGSYQIETDRGTVRGAAVVVATGGLSIPKIGATDFGYRVASSSACAWSRRRPGLVPLTFDEQAWAPYAQLSGLSLPVRIETGTKKARGEFLTKTCCSPTAASRARRCCRSPATGSEGTPMAEPGPRHRPAGGPGAAKARSRKRIANELALLVPSPPGRRLGAAGIADWQRPIAEASDKALARLAEQPGALGTHAHRHRGLPQGRGHAGRHRHARPVAADDGMQSSRGCISSARWWT